MQKDTARFPFFQAESYKKNTVILFFSQKKDFADEIKYGIVQHDTYQAFAVCDVFSRIPACFFFLLVLYYSVMKEASSRLSTKFGLFPLLSRKEPGIS